MSINSTVKAKRASKRFMLVRLTPARYVNDSLSLVGGVYTMTFPYPVASVERNGSALTKDTSTPSTNDHYYFDESGQTLSIKLASAPSSTNIIVVYYYLFLTGNEPQRTYETPTDTATTVRDWEPKLVSYPRLSQSISNLVGGVFSIQSSNLQIINTDYSFQSYLTVNDSFYQKQVEIWMAVDDVSNIYKIFTGRVVSVKADKSVVTLDVSDGFYQLKSSAFMGDTTQEAYFIQASDSFPNLYGASNFQPVPFIFGKNRFLNKAIGGSTNDWQSILELGSASFGYDDITILDANESTKAVCTNFTAAAASNANRTWGLARTSGDFRTLSFGTPTSSVLTVKADSVGNHAGEGYFSLEGSKRAYWYMNYSSNNSNLKPNDTFVWTDGSNTYHMVVTSTSSTVVKGFILDAPPFSSQTTLATSGLQTNQAPAIVIYDSTSGKTYIPAYGLDFTYTITTTSGGNKYMSITFVNDFETATIPFDGSRNHVNLAYLHPNTHTIAFRLEQDTTGTYARHDKALQTILEAAGFSVDSTTFSAAGAALTANCSFMIPNFDEADYGSYLKYCEDLLSSTLGYVRINSNEQVEYKLLAAPSPSTSLDTNLILLKSQRVAVEYQDIVSELIASNPHRPAQEDLATTTSTVKSAKSKHLHGIDRRDTFRHVLDDITGRISAILSVRSARRVTYDFSTATENLDSLLGDDLTLSSSIALGGDGTADLKIVTLDVDTNNVAIQATDLKDL